MSDEQFRNLENRPQEMVNKWYNETYRASLTPALRKQLDLTVKKLLDPNQQAIQTSTAAGSAIVVETLPDNDLGLNIWKPIPLAIGANSEADEGTWQLSRLEVLCLKALYQAEILWFGAITPNRLPMLRKLDISFCHGLKQISWVLLLKHIESINIDTCTQMEEMIGGKRGVHVPNHLPRLKTLALRNLPKLKSLCDHPLSVPSLEYIKVLQCPQMTLPHLTGGSIPGVIHGEKEWWNTLDRKTSAQEFSSFWFFQVAE